MWYCASSLVPWHMFCREINAFFVVASSKWRGRRGSRLLLALLRSVPSSVVQVFASSSLRVGDNTRYIHRKAGRD